MPISDALPRRGARARGSGARRLRPGDDGRRGSPSRTKVNVAGQAVTIAAPPGFCIDAESTTVNADGAFVLMSDCALLGGGRARSSRRSARR